MEPPAICSLQAQTVGLRCDRRELGTGRSFGCFDRKSAMAAASSLWPTLPLLAAALASGGQIGHKNKTHTKKVRQCQQVRLLQMIVHSVVTQSLSLFIVYRRASKATVANQKLHNRCISYLVHLCEMNNIYSQQLN